MHGNEIEASRKSKGVKSDSETKKLFFSFFSRQFFIATYLLHANEKHKDENSLDGKLLMLSLWLTLTVQTILNFFFSFIFILLYFLSFSPFSFHRRVCTVKCHFMCQLMKIQIQCENEYILNANTLSKWHCSLGGSKSDDFFSFVLVSMMFFPFHNKKQAEKTTAIEWEKSSSNSNNNNNVIFLRHFEFRRFLEFYARIFFFFARPSDNIHFLHIFRFVLNREWIFRAWTFQFVCETRSYLLSTNVNRAK